MKTFRAFIALFLLVASVSAELTDNCPICTDNLYQPLCVFTGDCYMTFMNDCEFRRWQCQTLRGTEVKLFGSCHNFSGLHPLCETVS